MPALDALRGKLPAYARDLGLNLDVLAAETVLTEQQKWGAFLASAYAVSTPTVLRAIEAAAAGAGLSETARTAAKAAAAIMGMNNVYFRALHLLRDEQHRKLPARLRMHVLTDHGVERADFELWALAVSAIHGCGACLDAHNEALKSHGVPAPAVQGALRIAAVVHAVTRVIAAEEAAAT